MNHEKDKTTVPIGNGGNFAAWAGLQNPDTTPDTGALVAAAKPVVSVLAGTVDRPSRDKYGPLTYDVRLGSSTVWSGVVVR